DRLAAHHGMHAARIVADHASKRAVFMSGRIGRESQMVFFGCIPQVVVDQAGFNPGILVTRIQFQEFVQVFRKVDNDRDIATLSSEAGSASTPKNRDLVLPADFYRAHHIFDGPGYHDADGRLAIHREVGGVQSARTIVESYFTLDAPG